MKTHIFLKNALFGIAGVLATSVSTLHAGTISVDFNNTSDLVSSFNGNEMAADANVASGGLNGSASVELLNGSFFAGSVWTSKTGFANSVGSTYSVSLYLQNTGDHGLGGLGGLGFSTTDSDRPWDNCAPTDSLGVNLTPNRAYFFNNMSTSGISVDSALDLSGITWLKLTLTLTSLGADSYDMSYLVQASDSNGEVTEPGIGATLSGISTTFTNANISEAPVLYPFFLREGDMFTNADNFSATDVAVVPEPSTYAFLLVGGAAMLNVMRRRKIAAR